ncbi:MAG: universal stress protein [Aphanocapsa feldmannii 277cV]|uniref:Universal stress protein n=1 Tax=Aphanocapsa feldmannii 277cV TaxID=2507553 RepID=A0A524RMN9_9CHRO|nr:MAG: universal stress protein [Aphanocapsa feldmannii 288cV]TGG91896.1 MAG: universal stress protein [Aphanocapsa feldmannii 277cV]
MFRTILIADSGKGHVEEMARMMRDVPAFNAARFNLLHVIPDQSKQSLEDHMREGGAMLARAVSSLGLDPSHVNTILRQGDTKQTVLKVAAEINADLIVMGSRGLGRLQSILANSASQYVFQLSTRPMLLVRDDLYVRHLNHLMVALDGTEVGDHALREACELVRGIPGGRLSAVHVGSSEVAPSRGGTTPADRLLRDAVSKARRQGVELETLQRSGDTAREICLAATDANCDLLVIASPDRRPSVATGLVDLDKLLGTSVSDYVRVKAPCPVLLVREPEGMRV